MSRCVVRRRLCCTEPALASVDRARLVWICTNAAWTFGRFFPAKNVFAAGCVFPDYATAVIFYPVIKTMKIFVHIIWVLPHSDNKF